MGQATVDLPDPLNSAAPLAGENVDDLLSQLAGEEIDRLLAETESEAPPEAQAPAAVVPPVVAAVAAPEPAVRAEAAPDAAELDELFDKITATENTSESPSPPPDAAANLAPQPPPTARPPVITSEIPAENQPAPAHTAAAQPGLLEQFAATQPSPEEQALDAAIDQVAAETEGHVELAQVPLFLKPLVWLNAPLLAAPDAVREAVGKVAIMTLVNAVGVLAYVLVFRRH